MSFTCNDYLLAYNVFYMFIIWPVNAKNILITIQLMLYEYTINAI